MKRKLKWTAVVLVVLLVGFGVALFLLPRDRITAESWKKIRIGMTVEEVEEILGGPGITSEECRKRHFAPGKFSYDGVGFREPRDRVITDGDILKNWKGKHGLMQIGLDSDGHVIAKYFLGLRSADPTFLDHIRDWLGW
jgi:hypothetical protein